MEEHQESDVENQNDKEENVAPSPDSGVSLSYEEENPCNSNSVQDTNSEKTSPAKRIQCVPSQTIAQNTLYPFFYKYPDNRKLTLLKSLSQDSEYSLDTSLFDAEDFLQEMGFAGSGDPPIPERFLPSLLQRLSKFPESEIESLNDRIIQSIGCFKRKEGKRRLFRNLSMGKSEQNHGRSVTGILNNSYPLIRSNTGPASFSFNNAPSGSEANHSSQDRRSSLNNSNNSSFSEETLFPQSPIAILVSAASEDYEDKSLEEESLCEQAISDSDKGDPPDISSQLSNEREEFTNNCSVLENKLAERLKESSIAAEDAFNQEVNSVVKLEQDSQNTLQNIMESKQPKEENEELQIEDQVNLVKLNNCGGEVSSENEGSTSSIINSSSMMQDNICSIVKPPLRRLSQTTNYSQQNSTFFGSIAFKDNYIDHTNLISETSNSKLNHEEGQNDVENDNSTSFDSLTDISESMYSISGKDDTESLIGMTKQELVHPISENNKFESVSDSIGVEVKIKQSTFNKPKYTRDDSLTNFLSSMLDTNDSLSPNSPESSQVFSFDYTAIKNQIKSPELPSPNPFIQKEIIVKTEISQDKSSPSYANKESKAANVLIKEKVSNRKRRMLRRMSSSINHYDEETSVMNSEPSNFVPYPLQSLSSPFIPSSHLPLRNTFSAPQISSCQPIYPCCRLPSRNICSCYETHNKNSIENRDDFSWSSQYDYNTRIHPFEEAMVCSSNRKLKRRCNRNRYLSCPPSIANFNFNPFCGSQRLSVSTHNLNIDPSCNHACHNCLPSYSRCFHSPVDMWSNEGFQNRTTASFQGGYSSDPQSPGTWRGMSKLDRKRASQNNFCSLHTDHTLLTVQNPKDPDHDNQEKSTPTVSRECKSFLSNKDSYIQRKPRRDRNCFQKQASVLSPHTSKESYSCDDVFLPESESHPVFQREVISDNFYKSKEVSEFQVCSSSENRDILEVGQLNRKDQSEYLFPDNIQSFVPCEKELISVENNTFSVPSQHSKLDINCNCNKPLKISNSYPLQNVEDSWNNADTRKSDLFCSTENINVKSFDACDSRDQLSPKDNKREALYEKKIRAFSKFLNNLTKSALDTKFESDYKTVSNSNFPDKAPEYCLSNSLVKDATTNDEGLTASPELDKLVKLLNSMELSKSSEKYNYGSREASGFQKNKRVSPVYENRVSLEINDANQPHFIPVSYTSSISMQISDDDKELHTDRKEEEFVKKSTVRNEPSLCKRKNNIRRYSLQMSFKEVSKELEELQISIQKAKEMRISASKELHLLQELLSKDACEDQESIIEKNSTKIKDKSQNTDLTSDVKKDLEALADLRNKSEIGETEDAEFWQKEMKKIKEENDQTWRAKLDVLEQRLASQEEELRMVQSVNENLQKQLELQTLGSPSCHCRSDVVQNGFGRIDSAFEDDEEYLNHKSSIPIQSSRQECERLQEQLMEAEQRADQLNLLLNQKLIELNKLQLTLSKQTKEMIELEKSYLQLQCKLRKGTSKPVVAKLCSRTSPFNSKNLCPKPSPPASPHPNGLS